MRRRRCTADCRSCCDRSSTSPIDSQASYRRRSWFVLSTPAFNARVPSDNCHGVWCRINGLATRCWKNIALFCTVFQLFDMEYYRDLEIWVRGHSRSFKLAPFESLGAISFLTSIVTILHYFRDKARYWSKIVIFSYSPCIRRPR